MAPFYGRPDGKSLLHHSDRGCQYTSNAYQQTLRTLGITCSMSRTGNCWDNAVMERKGIIPRRVACGAMGDKTLFVRGSLISMYGWFTDVTKKAKPGERAAIRALQAWQYLIAKASNRQIVKYDELRELMEYADNRPLSSILGCVAYYCIQNDLPPLTLIVVNQSGLPGHGFPGEQMENWHESRENVFSCPWYRLVPPTTQEFREAHSRARQSSR